MGRWEICYELGYRAAKKQDLSALLDTTSRKKILFLNQSGIVGPDFGDSVALRTIASPNSVHEFCPARAAGRLYCFELDLRNIHADGGDRLPDDVGSAGIEKHAEGADAAPSSDPLQLFKVALVADVIAPAAQKALDAAGLRRLWLGRGALTPLDHVASGAVKLGASFKPFFFLAACVVIRNSRGECLLTRRNEKMRTFPHCWVFPGGGHDGSEPLETTALREAHEETGLRLEPGQLKRLCLWESAFPTTLQGCLDAGGLKRHQLVVFFVCQLSEDQTKVIDEQGLTLQEEEVDEAVWLSKEHIAVLGRAKIGITGVENDDGTLVPSCIRHASGERDGSSIGIPLHLMNGVYPDPSTGQGCGEGHVFALTVLAHEEI